MTEQNNKTNKQTTLVREGASQAGGAGSISSFILCQVHNPFILLLTLKKKDFMKQDKITYDYMKHNCDKS